MLERAMHYSHTLLKQAITSGDSVIDATVGNGGDTVFLASLVGPFGKVFGFDIQKEAIETTQQKLLLTGLSEQVELFQQGHETIDSILPENSQIAAAIFNLGYLPKSDKSVITQADTTLSAVEHILPRLRKTGLIILVVYYGHDGGVVEKDAVLNYCQMLPQENFNVLQYGFVNQRNQPPFLLAIEKK